MDLRRLLRAARLLQAAARTPPEPAAQARRRGDRASATRLRRAGRAAATSPRRSCRSGHHRKVEREMGEDVADAAEPFGARRGASVQSLPGSAAIPPSRPFAGRRTSQTRAVALDPPGDAVAVRARPGAPSAPGKASGAPLAKAAQCAASGQSPQRGGFGPADASRQGPSSPGRNRPAGRRHHREHQPLDLAAARAARAPWSRAITRSTLVSTAAAFSPNAIAAIAADV